MLPLGAELSSVRKWVLSRMLAPQTASGLSLFFVLLFFESLKKSCSNAAVGLPLSRPSRDGGSSRLHASYLGGRLVSLLLLKCKLQLACFCLAQRDSLALALQSLSHGVRSVPSRCITPLPRGGCALGCAHAHRNAYVETIYAHTLLYHLK